MAQIPKSFREAFRHKQSELAKCIYVSSSLMNKLLQNDILNEQHVDELKV